jgi:hypothetical protein
MIAQVVGFDRLSQLRLKKICVWLNLTTSPKFLRLVVESNHASQIDWPGVVESDYSTEIRWSGQIQPQRPKLTGIQPLHPNSRLRSNPTTPAKIGWAWLIPTTPPNCGIMVKSLNPTRRAKNQVGG